MTRALAALAVGIVFGLGLAISRMIDPAKVLGFLDLAGRWDPSLLLVMAGAVGIGFTGFRVARGRATPLLDTRFYTADRRDIDWRLATGAAVFGIGWGLVGVCPGPALAALAYAETEGVTFLAAMTVGALAARGAAPLLARRP
ncbi:MAG: YeeE/YedE family protein [Alphaproteobacteria bacterium]|nr:YeeE/YedE family protein [Alphaproteobacteria bacterium]